MGVNEVTFRTLILHQKLNKTIWIFSIPLSSFIRICLILESDNIIQVMCFLDVRI